MQTVETTFREMKTSLGPIVVMSHTATWDEYPDLLNSGVPCFVEEELEVLKAMPAEQRRAAYARRVKAQDEEWQMRQIKDRTVWG